MHCPDCGYDNIPGADHCDKCGQALTRLQVHGSEMERAIASHPVSVLAMKNPVSVHPDATVRSAVEEMVRDRIGCVLVTNGTDLVGIFTERDVLNRVSPDRAALDQPVARYMTSSPMVLKTNDSIAYALHAMSVNGYRHLPVVDEAGHAVSIISARDVLRLLAVRFADIRG